RHYDDDLLPMSASVARGSYAGGRFRDQPQERRRRKVSQLRLATVWTRCRVHAVSSSLSGKARKFGAAKIAWHVQFRRFAIALGSWRGRGAMLDSRLAAATPAAIRCCRPSCVSNAAGGGGGGFDYGGPGGECETTLTTSRTASLAATQRQQQRWRGASQHRAQLERSQSQIQRRRRRPKLKTKRLKWRSCRQRQRQAPNRRNGR
uniref:Os01g0778700 protein n=1 Tax=Macrostomum lignano TaxID=282301 RepID=A0A1I8F7V4_9PLAT